MALGYTIREGFSGFLRAKFAVFTSVSAMAIAILLIGLFLLIGYQAQQVSTWITQKVSEIEVFLTEADDDIGEALRNRMQTLEGVSTATYISKQEAEEIFVQEFGKIGDVYVGQQEPFLPASIKVRVTEAFATPKHLSKLTQDIEKMDYVDDVVYNQPLLVSVQKNLQTITWVGFLLGALVVLAALFLVGNTIRLTIYARRMLIRTMKLVGATNAFIRRPFLVEGIAQGILAGILGGAILFFLYQGIRDALPDLILQAWPGGTPLVLILLLLLIGILLGWIGSLFAVRRFIKDVTLH